MRTGSAQIAIWRIDSSNSVLREGSFEYQYGKVDKNTRQKLENRPLGAGTVKTRSALGKPISVTPLFHSFSASISFSWVMLAVHFFKPRAVHMGIDLRGRDIRMSEHRLHRPQIRAALEQVSCERMAQGMRCHSFIDPRRESVSSDELPKSLPGQRFAGARDKEVCARSSFQQRPPAIVQILRKPLPSPDRKRVAQ